MASELKLQLTRLVAVAVLLAAGVAAFGTTFAPYGYVVAGGIGAVAGLAIATVPVRWDVRALLFFVILLLLGPLAMNRGDILPTPSNMHEFVVLGFTAWERVVTVNLPQVTTQFGMLAIPYVTAFVAGVAAGSAVRRNHFVAAVFFGAVPLIVAISLGTAKAWHPAILGSTFGVAVVMMLAANRARGTQGVLRRATRLVVAAAVLAVAAGAGLAFSPLVTASDRQLVRNYITGDLQPYEYPSPLEKLRDYRTNLRGTTLMTVSGLPANQRIRVATMDRYDGFAYRVAGGQDPDNMITGVFGPYTSSTRAGSEAATANLPVGNYVDIHLVIDGYHDVWIPGPTRINSINCSGSRRQDILDGLYFNQSTGTAMTTVGLKRGDSLSLGGTVTRNPDEADLVKASFAKVVLPQDVIPTKVAEWAAAIVAPIPNPIDKVRALQSFLQRGMYADEKTAPAGLDQGSIVNFLTAPQLIGTDEQYAVTMALMAKSLGIPARVVTGFRVEPDGKTIVGGDAEAWVEVAFENLGWVSFDPSPQAPPMGEAPSGPAQDTSSSAAQDDQPQQPPPPPPPEQVPPYVPPPSPWLPLWYVLRVAREAAGFLAVPVAAALIVVATKALRRRRRRSLPDPAQRIYAGWHEVADTAIDLGMARSSGTRLETAARARTVTAELGPLARLADAGTFAPTVPDEAVADEFWAAVDGWRDDLRRTAPAVRWLRQATSVRSLTPARRARTVWQVPTLPWTSRVLASGIDYAVFAGLVAAPITLAARYVDGWPIALWLAVGIAGVTLNLLLTAATGQSIGKRLFNVRIELVASKQHASVRLTVPTVVARAIIHCLLLLLGLAALWSVLLRSDRRGWHDLLTGTEVVTAHDAKLLKEGNPL
ncbi:MAG: RDD family protein [Nocardiaceae bacterium]|nr:RDD family protein [Nocardiaceae bacterium]